MTKAQIEAFKKITPGPWERIGATQIVKFGEDWACIAEASNPRSDNQREGRGHLVERADICNARFDEACANATAIAVLPDLLAEREKMIEMLKEMREACAACFRVIATTSEQHIDLLDGELTAVGVKQGFGQRCQELIAEAEGGE